MDQAGGAGAGEAGLRPGWDSAPEALKTAQGVCHRAKNDLNTLYNIVGLASLYARSPQELAEALEGWVMAMSQYYTLVAETRQPPTLERLAEMVMRRNLNKLSVPARLSRQLPAMMLSLRLCSPISLWLHEIIDNALKHGLERVTDPCLRLEGALDDRGLRLSVADNGAGLPPGFDPKRDARLGLKVAMAIADRDLHKGAWSSATPGRAWRPY